MIDDDLLATYENRVSAAMRESENPIAIAADDPAELIEIIRNARRYLALREHGIIADLKQDAEWLFAGQLDAAADRMLEGGE